MNGSKTVLSLTAHPDDSEFACAGTLALLHRKGWEIHIATMTPGDGGSAQFSREKISRIRKAEAAESAKILNGIYHCLECDDIFVMYDRPTLLKAIKLMRQIRPTIVFAPSPKDYMFDHEMASRVAQAACFACGVKNVETSGAEAFEPVPYLYYVDALEGKDKFGKEIKPEILTDITSVMDIKEKMLCCHESQRQWLMVHNDIDEYIISMKEFASERGKMINCQYAEGFRQHLGHSYPQDNILKTEFDNLVHEI